MGHRFLFEQLCSEGASRGLKPLIVTFDTHPRAVLESDYQPQLLTTFSERKALLNEFGEVLVLSFAEIHSLTAAEFMQLLCDRYEVSVLLMGYDHRFGSDRLQKPFDYRRAGEECGVEVLTMREFMSGEWHVSSTEIRQALQNGNITLANELLGRPYALHGKVVHGNGIGRTLGFPTANIRPEDPCKVIPKAGVYEVKVKGERTKDEGGERREASGERLEVRGICNVGTNPTVGNTETTIEVYIPSFSGDLYDQNLRIEFVRFLREEHHFESLEALQEQIKADVDNIRHRV